MCGNNPTGSSGGGYGGGYGGGLPTYQPNQRAFPGAWNMNQQPTLTAGGTGNWNTGMAQGNAMITGQGPQWAGENLGYYMNQPQNSNPANYGRWNWQTVSPYPAPSSGYPQPGGGGGGQPQPYYPPQQPGVPLPPGQGGQPGGQPMPGQNPNEPGQSGGAKPPVSTAVGAPRPQFFSPYTPEESALMAQWSANNPQPLSVGDAQHTALMNTPDHQAGVAYSQSPEYQAMMARVNALGL